MIIADKCPESDPIMAGAWAACLNYTISRTDALKRFEEETGNVFRPATNGIEKMIDDATGYEVEFLGKFIDWFNLNIWGTRDGE